MSKDEKNQKKISKKTKRDEKRLEKKARLSSLSEKEKKKRLLKKIFLSIIIALSVLVLLYVAVGKILQSLSERQVLQKEEKYQSFNHYDVLPKEEWENIDIFSDEEYLKMDYKPHFTSTGLGGRYLLEDIPSGIENGAHRFFKKYFDILQSGNYKSYPELFSDKYKESLTGFEKNVTREFPPQKVYNIDIEELGRFDGNVVDGKECIVGLYRVSFNIYKNDGLFRSDIGKDINLGVDVARPLLFELITYDEGSENEITYINNLYTESSITSTGDDNR